MQLVVHISLPPEARFLATTRRAIAAYLEELGCSEETASDIVLAMNEACNNVVRHARSSSNGDDPYQVVAEITEDEVILTVEDNGRGFDEDALERILRAPQDESATSGRGLRIINELMTSVEVQSPRDGDRGTRLTMHRRLA